MVNVLRPKMLIIDDDPQTRRYLHQEIAAAGYAPCSTGSGVSALQMIQSSPPYAIILDLELRDMRSKDVIAQTRMIFSGPMVVLSAFSREIEKIEALDLGADAFIAKPFDVKEILARLRVASRRRMVARGITPVVQAKGLCIDLINRTVTKDGQILHLTELQYTVLATLAASPGHVISYEYITSGLRSLRSTRLAIKQLRRKIEQHPYTPSIIVTEPRVGYRLRI